MPGRSEFATLHGSGRSRKRESAYEQAVEAVKITQNDGIKGQIIKAIEAATVWQRTLFSAKVMEADAFGAFMLGILQYLRGQVLSYWNGVFLRK
jgi:hypothetical protein